jgi:hypothetical protein
MLDKVLRYLRGISSGRGADTIDRSSDSEFVLALGRLPMAVLSRNSEGWTLRYTDAFKKQNRIAPLVPFPDINKVYRSSVLWPFFSVRIPSIARPEVERTVRQEHLDYNDVAAMLRRFGRKSVADPFELRPDPDAHELVGSN